MHFRSKMFLAAASALLCLSASLSVQAGPPKPAVAVFSQDDPQFSETITLYADGKYQQAETQKKGPLYRSSSLPGTILGTPVFPVVPLFAPRTGTWRVLDKEGGQPIAFKTLASLPKDAVIEFKNAMPFGMVWDNQLPYQFSENRTLTVSDFQAPPPVSVFQVPQPAKK